MSLSLLKQKDNKTTVGLNLYKPNYLQDKFEDNLCKKILELKGDDLDLKVIRGNIRTLRQHGLRIFENIDHKNQFKISKRIAKPMKKLRYSNSYLHQISNLMYHSKDVINYCNERRNIFNRNQEHQTVVSPMMSTSRFYSSQNNFNKTRNSSLSPSSRRGTLTKRCELKSIHHNSKRLREELKLIQPENEEFFRFDDRLSNIPDRIIDKLKVENNFIKDKDKDILFNDTFTRKRESMFRSKDPLDKSKYLRREYFDKRSPYVKTAHLIEIRHNKSNEVLYKNSPCRNYKLAIVKSKNMLEFDFND